MAGRFASPSRAVVTALERSRDDPGATWISPGWLDIQVNGYDGHDPNATGRRGVDDRGMVRALWPDGVTGSLHHDLHRVRGAHRWPRCARSPPPARRIRWSRRPSSGSTSRARTSRAEDGPRGAHPLRHVRPPDVAEYRRWQEAAGGRIRIVTLSPEYDEADRRTSGRSSPTGSSPRSATPSADRRPDPGRRRRRRALVDAPRQRRPRPDPAPPELHLGPARRGPPERRLHLRRPPPAAGGDEDRRAGEGHRAERSSSATRSRSPGSRPGGYRAVRRRARSSCCPTGRLELAGTPLPGRRGDRPPGLPRQRRAARRRDARGRRPDGHRQPVTPPRPADVAPATRVSAPGSPRTSPCSAAGRDRTTSRCCGRSSAARTVYEAPA